MGTARMTWNDHSLSPTSLALIIRQLLATSSFLRFLLVGGVNTVVGYGLFCVALALMPTTFAALLVSSIVAVLFNFLTTGTYVFRSRHPRLLVGFFGVYAIVLVYNAAGLALLARAAIGPHIGALLMLPGAVAIAYGLNRRYVFGFGS